jgi:hypothetical protein
MFSPFKRRDKKVAMAACLAKMARMASSTKRRRASSTKNNSAGKAQVIAVKRTDALPRKGGPMTRRKPVVQPPIDAPTEPLVTAVARSSKKAHSVQQAKGDASRTKPARATGRRTTGKLNRPAAIEAVIAPAVDKPLEAPEVEALACFETEVEVDVSAIVEETAIVEHAPALPVEALTFLSNEIGLLPISGETRRLALAHTAATSPAPATPTPHHGKRALVAVVSQLFSTLRRWTGVR